MLMGKNGSRQVVVNSHGREMGCLGEKDAEAGKDLKLTVDIDLQIAAEEALAIRMALSSPWTRAAAKFWQW